MGLKIGMHASMAAKKNDELENLQVHIYVTFDSIQFCSIRWFNPYIFRVSSDFQIEIYLPNI